MLDISEIVQISTHKLYNFYILVPYDKGHLVGGPFLVHVTNCLNCCILLHFDYVNAKYNKSQNVKDIILTSKRSDSVTFDKS